VVLIGVALEFQPRITRIPRMGTKRVLSVARSKGEAATGRNASLREDVAGVEALRAGVTRDV
jgi:hypothetical protein